MNYVKHLNSVFVDIYSDNRLKAGHISLYLALFFYWNLHHFADEFYANRLEIMKMAKIGSRSSYHRLIRELSEWDYITYLPTQDPTQKTMVRMSHFCTDSSTEIGLTGTLMKHYCPKNVPVTLYKKQSKTSKLIYKSKPKNELEVIDFFKSKNWPVTEAIKFHNHYLGVGWKIGGRAKIADWKAIAENWMLKALEIKKNSRRKFTAPREDNLKTANQKNYGQPL